MNAIIFIAIRKCQVTGPPRPINFRVRKRREKVPVNTYAAKHETAEVNLRKTVLAVEQATVTVGLASIGNDDSTFLFATDRAGLDIDPISQELLLNVNMALQGSHTGLARFGYQVAAVVATQTTGISGTIRWAKSIFDPRASNEAKSAMKLPRMTCRRNRKSEVGREDPRPCDLIGIVRVERYHSTSPL